MGNTENRASGVIKAVAPREQTEDPESSWDQRKQAWRRCEGQESLGVLKETSYRY